MKNFRKIMESQDGLVLAVRFLNEMGISCLQLSKQYGLSRNTLSDILHGKSVTQNRQRYEMMLMLALKQVLSVAQCCEGKRTREGLLVSPDLIKDTIIEVASVNLGLPKYEKLWLIWAEKDPK